MEELHQARQNFQEEVEVNPLVFQTPKFFSQKTETPRWKITPKPPIARWNLGDTIVLGVCGTPNMKITVLNCNI
jgi:hypothetical protein